MKKITRPSGSTQKNCIFDYDAMGHRVAKHVYSSDNILIKSTYYVLDATGNVLSVYERTVSDAQQSVSFTQTEKHIYGSTRLGLNSEKVEVLGSQYTYTIATVSHVIGNRLYELVNHLGNVLTVISDKPVPHYNGNVADYYLADIRQSQDYSPFGVILHKRNYTLSAASGSGVPYRYGYQGSEMDNEVKGNGNSYTTEFRQLDPRLGRWLSIDPVFHPNQSPYCSMDNNPIWFNDVLGNVTNGKDKNWEKGEKGSRKISNKNGTTTYDAAGGFTITLPARAEVLSTFQDANGNGKIDYNGVTYAASIGDVHKFKLDNVVYTATFSKGKFMGYKSASGKKYSCDVVLEGGKYDQRTVASIPQEYSSPEAKESITVEKINHQEAEKFFQENESQFKDVANTYDRLGSYTGGLYTVPSVLLFASLSKDGLKAFTGGVAGKIAWPIMAFGTMMQMEATMQQRAADGFENIGNTYRNNHASAPVNSKGIYVIHYSFVGPYHNQGEYWEIYDVLTRQFIGSTGR